MEKAGKAYTNSSCDPNSSCFFLSRGWRGRSATCKPAPALSAGSIRAAGCASLSRTPLAIAISAVRNLSTLNFDRSERIADGPPP